MVPGTKSAERSQPSRRFGSLTETLRLRPPYPIVPGLGTCHPSIVGDRVVFNIKGNSYRLVVAVDYRRQIVFIKWLGPHAAYDKIDVKTVKYGD
jgi:mRNA-degrading endonuclease HigB of HigAB toxin-antitoxin module